MFANPAMLFREQWTNVCKDHQKGDKLYGVPMRSFDEPLGPNEYLLRSMTK
jgi:hypothetical protein